MSAILSNRVINPQAPTQPTPRQLFIEAAVILVGVFVAAMLWPWAKTLVICLAMAYVLVERRWRQRPWSDYGQRWPGLGAALWQHRVLFILPAAINLVLVVIAAIYPDFLVQVQQRLPTLDAIGVAAYLFVLAGVLLIEETLFRGVFQARLSAVMGLPLSLLVVSFILALMHWLPGQPAVVALDLTLVFIHSLLYGLLFVRSQQLPLVWLAHLLADSTALLLILVL